MAKKRAVGVTWKEFAKQRGEQWEAQHVLANGIWQFLLGLQRRYTTDESRALFVKIEMLCNTLHELADVEITPVIMVTYQPGLFPDDTAAGGELEPPKPDPVY